MDQRSRNYRKAHAAMVVGMFLLGSYEVLTKAALNGGINQLVFCTYRDLVAVVILGPIAYFSEKKERPPLTLNIFISFFFLGLTGIFGKQLLFVFGLSYTNPTFSAAMQPTTPILTFLFTLATGTDTINLVKLEGKLKVVGLIIFATGALVITLVKGPSVLGSLASTWFGLDRWHIGVLCLVGECFCSSAYLVIQCRILEKYPATISLTAYSYLVGVFLMATTGLISLSNLTDWHLTWSEFLAVSYAGLAASALYYGLLTWSNKILGPCLVSMYFPLQTVTAGLLSTMFLRSPIYLGSIIGAVVIVAGLYMVTWATHREREAAISSTSNLAHLHGLSEPLLP